MPATRAKVSKVGVDVTLLDRAACHVFQPLLYQCAAGTLSIAHLLTGTSPAVAAKRGGHLRAAWAGSACRKWVRSRWKNRYCHMEASSPSK